MSRKNDDNNGMQEGFGNKADRLASSKTPVERKNKAKRAVKKFGDLAKKAADNGLTDEILADILTEIDNEREQERLSKEGLFDA